MFLHRHRKATSPHSQPILLLTFSIAYLPLSAQCNHLKVWHFQPSSLPYQPTIHKRKSNTQQLFLCSSLIFLIFPHQMKALKSLKPSSKEMVAPKFQKASLYLSTHSYCHKELYCGYVKHSLGIIPSFFLSLNRSRSKPRMKLLVIVVFRINQRHEMG